MDQLRGGIRQPLEVDCKSYSDTTDIEETVTTDFPSLKMLKKLLILINYEDIILLSKDPLQHLIIVHGLFGNFGSELACCKIPNSKLRTSNLVLID